MFPESYSKKQVERAKELYDGNRISLFTQLQQQSVKHGEFTLRSGKKSDFYVDCRPVILSPYGMTAIGVVVSYKCWVDFQSAQFAATGVGGSYMAAAAAMIAEGYIIHVRDDRKEYGMNNKIELPANFDKDHSDITVIDDVLTTGSSLMICLDSLKEAGLEVAGCLVLVDREEGGRQTVENKYKIPVKSIFTKSDFK